MNVINIGAGMIGIPIVRELIEESREVVLVENLGSHARGG